MYFTILGLVLCLGLGVFKLCVDFSWGMLCVVLLVLGTQVFCIYDMYKIKKDEQRLSFWNELGEMSPDLQKEILNAGNEVVCGICGRRVNKADVSMFRLATGVDALAKGSKLRCTCKHCIKKRR